MIVIMTILFFAWPNPSLVNAVYATGPDLGPLGDLTEQSYGHDNECWVSVRPLYSGELEGLPLYGVFDPHLADLVGFEFRRPYYRISVSSPPVCNATSCTRPRSVHWDGFSVSLTDEQKFIHEILRSR